MYFISFHCVGPKYVPKQCHIDLVTPRCPTHSFGGENVDRASFLNGEIKNGYYMHARPATSDPVINISAAQYAPDHSVILPSSPRVSCSKANRFKDMVNEQN